MNNESSSTSENRSSPLDLSAGPFRSFPSFSTFSLTTHFYYIKMLDFINKIWCFLCQLFENSTLTSKFPLHSRILIIICFFLRCNPLLYIYQVRNQQGDCCDGINPFIYPVNCSVTIRTKVFFFFFFLLPHQSLPPSLRHKDPLCILGHVSTVFTAVIFAESKGTTFLAFN